MTDDVAEEHSLFISHDEIREEDTTAADGCISLCQSNNNVYITTKMTLDNNTCAYTAAIPANLAGSFPEGTVLQLLPDSTIVAVAPMKEPSSLDHSNTAVILKSSSFTTEPSARQSVRSVSNISAGNVDSPTPEVSVCSEGNIPDIDLSFFNESDETVPSTGSQNLNEAAVKELDGIIAEVSAQSLDGLQNDSILDDRKITEQAASEHKEPENSSDNMVMIDVSKPIQLSQNSLIMVNGQKCVLQHDSETGQVVAYPVKEQDKPRRRRGRPRKTSVEQVATEVAHETETSVPLENDHASEEEKEKGLLEVVNDDGALVRRSSRKRKKAKVLRDYETGNLKQELGSDVDDGDIVDRDAEIESRKKKAKGTCRSKKYGPAQPVESLASSNNVLGVKRQRGRPRKQITESEPTQAFLVQTADGQTLMMQVPLSSIPPDVTLQEMAQNIANKLNVGLNQGDNSSSDVGYNNDCQQQLSKTETSWLDKSPAGSNVLDGSLDNPSEPAVQDHSVGSTTNFSTVDQLENVKRQNESNEDRSCEDIISDMDNIIVDSVCDSEVGEVTLESGNCASGVSNKTDDILPDNLMEHQSQFINLEVPECPDESFCINISSMDSSSVDRSSIICSLSENLNSCVNKAVEQEIVDSLNNDQVLENVRIAKEFLISNDFVKEKINIPLLLQNVADTTSETPNADSCSSIQVGITEENSSNPANLQELVVNANTGFKSYDVTCSSEIMSNQKNPVEAQCLFQQIATLENIEIQKENIIFNCDSTHDMMKAKNETPVENHAIIGDIKSTSDLAYDKKLLQNSNESKKITVNIGPEAKVIKSASLSSGNQNFSCVLPLEKKSSIVQLPIEGANSNLATAVIPVYSLQELKSSEKLLPMLLPAQELTDTKKCKLCHLSFCTDAEIIQHFKVKHPRCICNECNYMAEHPYMIKRHSYRHVVSGCFCKYCGKKYKDHYILKMHIKMVHMPAEVLFTCEICEKQFNRKAHLKRHLRIHEPDKPYKCPHCDYRGCEKSDITKHQLIHEAPKHKCHLCEKSFRHIKNKELHLKRHYKQRDYKCGVCEFYGYTFTDIRKHIERRHTDPKFSICKDCGQACKNMELLKEHKRSGQCQTYLLEQELSKNENLVAVETKESLLLEEMPLDILGDPEHTQITCAISQSSGERLSALQNGQLVMSSVGPIYCNSQNGQIVVSGLEDSDLVSSDNWSLISVGKDSDKLVTLVKTEGKNISVPQKIPSLLPLECVTTASDKDSCPESYTLSEIETEVVS